MESTFAADYLEEVKMDDPKFTTNELTDSETGTSNGEAVDEDAINRGWV